MRGTGEERVRTGRRKVRQAGQRRVGRVVAEAAVLDVEVIVIEVMALSRRRSEAGFHRFWPWLRRLPSFRRSPSEG